MARPERSLIRRLATSELTAADLGQLRALFAAAWPDEAFDEHDWTHAMGGRHFVADVDGQFVSHASVVERSIEADGRDLRTGYVEAVATLPSDERRGFGSAVVAEASAYVRKGFELGALGTDRFAFYERLGWRRWEGPTAVRTAERTVRTPAEDGYVMVLLTPRTPPLDLGGLIACDWRPGDVW